MAQANGNAQNVHASGQPDTPVEVITALLQNALASDDVADVKSQLQKAYDVVAGLDPYLESVSTPPSSVSHGDQQFLRAAAQHSTAASVKRFTVTRRFVKTLFSCP